MASQAESLTTLSDGTVCRKVRRTVAGSPATATSSPAAAPVVAAAAQTSAAASSAAAVDQLAAGAASPSAASTSVSAGGVFAAVATPSNTPDAAGAQNVVQSNALPFLALASAPSTSSDPATPPPPPPPPPSVSSSPTDSTPSANSASPSNDGVVAQDNQGLSPTVSPTNDSPSSSESPTPSDSLSSSSSSSPSSPSSLSSPSTTFPSGEVRPTPQAQEITSSSVFPSTTDGPSAAGVVVLPINSDEARINSKKPDVAGPTTSSSGFPNGNTAVITIVSAASNMPMTSSSIPAGNTPSMSSNFTPALVGGVLGGFSGLVLIFGLLFFCVRRARRRRSESSASDRSDGKYYEFDRENLGPSNRVERIKATIDWRMERTVSVLYSVKDFIFHRGSGSGSPGVNMDRGNSQFIDPYRRSTAFRQRANSVIFTLRDRIAITKARATAALDWRWRLLKMRFSRTRDPPPSPAPQMSQRGPPVLTTPIPRSEITSTTADFSQLLAMEERERRIQQERDRIDRELAALEPELQAQRLTRLELELVAQQRRALLEEEMRSAPVIKEPPPLAVVTQHPLVVLAQPPPAVVAQPSPPSPPRAPQIQSGGTIVLPAQRVSMGRASVVQVGPAHRRSSTMGEVTSWYDPPPFTAAGGAARDSSATREKSKRFRSDPFDLEGSFSGGGGWGGGRSSVRRSRAGTGRRSSSLYSGYGGGSVRKLGEVDEEVVGVAGRGRNRSAEGRERNSGWTDERRRTGGSYEYVAGGRRASDGFAGVGGGREWEGEVRPGIAL